MCLLVVLGSQGIVVKYTAAIFFHTVDCHLRSVYKPVGAVSNTQDCFSLVVIYSPSHVANNFQLIFSADNGTES